MAAVVKDILAYISVVLAILAVVFVCWLVLWKFILEPNPLVRDFFDLDLKPKDTTNSKKKKK